jgi:hypothetical protein
MFTATQSGVGKITSTINAVNEIVRRICEAENLDWRECVFYDLQTWVGYPHHGFGYFCLDELSFAEGDHIHVDGWMERASSYDNPDFFAGIPRAIAKYLGDGRA